MALDQNLFTLNLKWSTTNPGEIDLVDPLGEVHYYRRQGSSPQHTFGLYEPLGGSLLSAVQLGANSKVKALQLFNPDATIEIKSVGTLSFRWSFTFEEHTFEWKREECYLIRKPDPPVLVAITKEPPGRIKSSLVQILDYNINRFDVQDRKGLEIVLLTSLLSFQDEDTVSPANSRTNSSNQVPQQRPAIQSNNSAPPPPPQKPQEAPEDQIAILQAREAREANEIVVAEFGEVQRYSVLCVDMLKDPTILFIAIRSLTPGAVPKVVAVADLTKRWIHREDLIPGLDDIHQYVTYDEVQDRNEGKKKKVIKLDDNKGKEKDSPYKPPENLTIRLSKIAMPELQPKARPSPSVSARPSSMVQTSSKPSDWKNKPHQQALASNQTQSQNQNQIKPNKQPQRRRSEERISSSSKPQSSKPPTGGKPGKLMKMNNISMNEAPSPKPALNSSHRPQGTGSPYSPQPPGGFRPQGSPQGPFPGQGPYGPSAGGSPVQPKPSSAGWKPSGTPSPSTQPAKPQQQQPTPAQGSSNAQGQQPTPDLATIGSMLGQFAINSISNLAHKAQEKVGKR